ncbi:MAG: Asp-tRNA(Asn)/Glu-tRNA(Gln) amidotransferase subunit GatC [Saprospiraceae bacterium]|nr:Asp-tRNA(Asn)/Glu-tRNA(Gln) amidotransferase subunit GatC [Saprospiraceae bacterium]
MKIDKQLISKLENLARLKLSEEESKDLQTDLNAILEMVEKLQELDTEGVEPLVYINEEVNVFRKDKVTNQVSQDEALRNAPDHDGSFFKVPKVINKKN